MSKVVVRMGVASAGDLGWRAQRPRGAQQVRGAPNAWHDPPARAISSPRARTPRLPPTDIDS